MRLEVLMSGLETGRGGRTVRLLLSMPIIMVLMLGSLGAQAQVQKQDLKPYPPEGGSVTISVDPAPANQLQSFQQLCDSSDLIAEVTVRSTTTKVREKSLETDVLLTVNRIFKGPVSVPQAMITQSGGVFGKYSERASQYPLMKLEQNYLVFLKREPQFSPNAAFYAPRYRVAGTYVGMFLIDGEYVHLATGAPRALRDKYEGVNLDKVLSEIR
jgi:hypothetical protein